MTFNTPEDLQKYLEGQSNPKRARKFKGGFWNQIISLIKEGIHQCRLKLTISN